MGQYVLIAFVVLVAILCLVYWRKVRNGWHATQRFLREVRVEMEKVSWPSRNDVIGSTIVVLVAIVVVSLIVAGTDEVLSTILDFVLNRKGA